MKKIFLFVLLGIFLCCSESDKVPQSSLIGTWELVQIEDILNNETLIPSENSEKFFISFEESKFEGSTGRNEFFGGYRTTSNNLILSEFGISEVAESEIGKEFNRALGSVYDVDHNTYRIIYTIENERLELRTSESIFIFKRQ